MGELNAVVVRAQRGNPDAICIWGDPQKCVDCLGFAGHGHVCRNCLAERFPFFKQQLIGNHFLAWKHVLSPDLALTIFGGRIPPQDCEWVGHQQAPYTVGRILRARGYSNFLFSPIGGFVEAKVFRHHCTNGYGLNLVAQSWQKQAILACLIPADCWRFDQCFIINASLPATTPVYLIPIHRWINDIPLREIRPYQWQPIYEDPRFEYYEQKFSQEAIVAAHRFLSESTTSTPGVVTGTTSGN